MMGVGIIHLKHMSAVLANFAMAMAMVVVMHLRFAQRRFAVILILRILTARCCKRRNCQRDDPTSISHENSSLTSADCSCDSRDGKMLKTKLDREIHSVDIPVRF